MRLQLESGGSTKDIVKLKRRKSGQYIWYRSSTMSHSNSPMKSVTTSAELPPWVGFLSMSSCQSRYWDIPVRSSILRISPSVSMWTMKVKLVRQGAQWSV